MKNKKLITFVVWVFLATVLSGLPFQLKGELLAQIGPVDTKAIGWLKGFWVFDDSRYLFEFTDTFAATIHGVKFFFYKRSSDHSRAVWVFTVVRSKKTGLWYFARGKYENGKFTGTTSRLDFMSLDHFVVYRAKNPSKIYYEAFRSKTPTLSASPSSSSPTR